VKFLHALPSLALVLAALALVQTLQILGGVTPILEGRLIDPDCYMRLDRVRALMEGGAWYDTLSLRHNAPFGETLHWTRLFDLLLLPAWALGGEPALWWWGIAIGPALEVLAVAALSFATRPILSSGGFALLGVLFVTAPGPAGVFIAGRPDHHGLLLLLMIAGLAPILRLAAGERRPNLSWPCGVALGLGLWVGVEALAAYGVALAILGAFWLAGDSEWRDILARTAQAAAITVFAALLVERAPADWLTPATDRLSIVHLALATLVAIGATLLARFDPQRHRIGWAALTAAIGLAILGALFPDFLRPPLAHLPPEVGEAWLDDLMEMRPLWPGDLRGLGRIALHLGPLIIALPFLAYRLRLGAPPQRRIALAGLIGLAVYVPAALYQIRFAPYGAALAVLPWSQAVLALRRLRMPMPARALLVVLALIGHDLAFTLIASQARAKGQTYRGALETCPWERIAPILAALPGAGGKPPIVFTTPYPGPELAYRARVAVIATPYHGNARSVIATHLALTGADDRALLALLAERRADYALLCRSGQEGRWLESRTGDNAHQRLLRGQAPRSFTRVEIADDLKGDFALYRISGWPAP
jgi:hypothetical protein